MLHDLYHDESKQDGYWHGMLLVPMKRRDTFLEQLEEIRGNTGYRHPVSLKGLSKGSGRVFRCVRGWLSLGSAALMQRFKGQPAAFYKGLSTPNPEFSRLVRPIGARFVLFRVRDGHQGFTHYPDYGSRVETTFRMGLKGGLHLFAGDQTELNITSLHFDGHEHYQRHVDIGRIVNRIGELRDGCRIADDLTVDDRSSDHRREDSQDYDDCQLLQLTDLLVSGFRTVLGEASNSAQRTVAHPLDELAISWHEGPARMKNSRWHKGFSISECYLKDDEWQFSNLEPDGNAEQKSLWDYPAS